MSSLTNWQKQQDKAEAKVAVLEGFILETQEQIADSHRRMVLSTKARDLFVKAAGEAQEQISTTIASIVTTALHIVFDQTYEFAVKFVVRRGSTEADLLLMKNGKEVDPLGNSGLGVANIIAIALRAAFIVLRGDVKKFMSLDEPTAALMVSKQVLAGDVLKTLCEKLGFRIVLTTHSPELACCADRVYLIGMDSKGISSAKVVESHDEIRSSMEDA